MYRKQHTNHLAIGEIHVPIAGTIDAEIRWVMLSQLMPLEELEEGLRISVQPHCCCSGKACTAGIWRAVHQAAPSVAYCKSTT
jgi:hypothetical protein